jgi:hypothetical protein
MDAPLMDVPLMDVPLMDVPFVDVSLIGVPHPPHYAGRCVSSLGAHGGSEPGFALVWQKGRPERLFISITMCAIFSPQSGSGWMKCLFSLVLPINHGKWVLQQPSLDFLGVL